MDENAAPDPKIQEKLNNVPPFESDIPQENEEVPQPVVEGAEDMQETPVQTTEDEALTNSKNPERTKEYIDRLKMERDQALSEARHFESGGWQRPVEPQIQPTVPFPDLTQQQINQTKQQLFDDNGYVDRNLLETLLSQANEEARLAREEAKQARIEAAKRDQRYEEERRTEQVQKVHRKFPMLDPDNVDEFNPKFWDAVRDKMVGQLARTGRQDFYQAAKELFPVYNTNVKKSVKEQAKATENKLRNINASVGGGTSTQRTTPEEYDSLVEGTRKGTKGSLAERLKRSGF